MFRQGNPLRSIVIAPRSLARLLAALAVAWVLGGASQSLAAPITVPTGLNPGDSYRLAFVTSGTRNGASTDIADYNTFVTSQANSSAELVLLGTTWTAIASTATVDARDNTNTNTGVDGTGVPIYLLNDVRLVDDYVDLWDNSIDTFFEIDQFGNLVANAAVYTGTNSNGVGHATLPLGAFNNVLGETFKTGAGWVAAGVNTAPAFARPFYAISGVLIAPEPGSALLLASGLLGLAAQGRRRKA